MGEENIETHKYKCDVSIPHNHESKFGNDIGGEEKEKKNSREATLLWSPAYDNEKFEAILQKFQIHPMLSKYKDQRENVFGFDNIVVSSDSPLDKANLTDDIISKEDMIRIAYECNFDEEAIQRVFNERGIKGWNERHHNCPLWDLNDVQRFEMAMTVHYKKFHKIQEVLPHKTVMEIIEFYYFWKQMPRYKEWKNTYGKNKTKNVPNNNTQYLKVKEVFEQDCFLKTDPLLELGFLDNLELDPYISNSHDVEQCYRKRKRDDAQMNDSLKYVFDVESVPLNA